MHEATTSLLSLLILMLLPPSTSNGLCCEKFDQFWCIQLELRCSSETPTFRFKCTLNIELLTIAALLYLCKPVELLKGRSMVGRAQVCGAPADVLSGHWVAIRLLPLNLLMFHRVLLGHL